MMTRQMKILSSIVVILINVLVSCFSIFAEAQEIDTRPIKPAYITMYDFATEWDLYYSHLTTKLIVGDRPGKWGILSDIKAALGKTVAEVLDAPVIAEAITEYMPMERQRVLKPIDDIITECTEILDVEKPEGWIYQDSRPNAQVTRMGAPHFLLLSSGLLELYEHRPAELRFIIGHELGHLKCNHLRSLAIARAILGLLATLTGNEEGIKVTALPPLGLIIFLTWAREAENSADRAGLLCAQDVDVANQALMRLLHGMKSDSPWLEENEKFDTKEVLSSFERWKNERFVNLLLFIKKLSVTHPFIPQRIESIKMWAKDPKYQEILSRQATPTTKRRMIFRLVELNGFGEGTPYVKVYYDNKMLFQLDKQPKVSNPQWQNVYFEFEFIEGCPVFLEIYDPGILGKFTTLTEKRLALGMFYPKLAEKEYLHIPLHQNIDQRVETISGFEAKVVADIEE